MIRFGLAAGICVLLFGSSFGGDAFADPASALAPAAAAARPPAVPVALYVLQTFDSSGRPCTADTDPTESSKAIGALVSARLGPSFDVMLEPQAHTPDVLYEYVKHGARAHVIVAAYCKTAQTYQVMITGYALPGARAKPLSASLSGSFDSLETADWSNLFGVDPLDPTGFAPQPLFPTVAYLPIGNDPSGIVNSRLLANLPLTAIATPAPAPIAPPPPGSPPPPQPPTTRLARCQSSAFRMLIAGRVESATQNTDWTRAIVAGSSLGFKQPAPWGAYYGIAGVALGLLYIPNTAQVSVDVFYCPPPVAGQEETGEIYWVGGGPITGMKVTPTIGIDTISQQRILDSAITDLEDQLDCIIDRKTKQMKLFRPTAEAKHPKPIYLTGTDQVWCSAYIEGLSTKHPDVQVEGPIDAPGSMRRPASAP